MKGVIMKKKLIALAAAALMAVALVGCASGSSSSSASASASGSASASASASAPAIKLVKEGTLTVGISPDYPPFENIENGEIVGFDPDLAAALGEKMGLKV